MTLQEFVTACREKAGLNQADFAEAIGLTSEGSAQTISNYEKGVTLPSLKILAQIARVAGGELEHCMVFWDPRLMQTREEENEEARAILERVLRSPSRDLVINYLRGFVRGRTSRAPRRRKPKRGAGGHTRDE